MLALKVLVLPLGVFTLTTAQATPCAASQTLTTLLWFNSSHNLDCLNLNFPPDSTWCYNVTADGTGYVPCVGPDARYLHYGTPPGPGECAGCYSLCGGPLLSGIDHTAPLGFGPPDTFTSNLCGYQSPPDNFLHNTEIGDGPLFCGAGSYPPGQFYGDSNVDEGSNGTFRSAPLVSCLSENGSTVYPVYEATFPLHCSRDAGNNATCTTDLPLDLPLVDTWASA